MQQAQADAHNARLEAHKARMESFVNRFKAKASKAKQAQSRMKAIQKLKFIPVEQNDPTVAFDFPEPETLSPPLISIEKANLGYGDKTIIKNINISLSPDERIGLVGANGNGKTTLARFIAKDLEPLSGTVVHHGKIKIGFYKQDHFEHLELNRTAMAIMSEKMPKANQTQVRSHLGRFGFSKDKPDQMIKQFSGGERARLLFACLTAESPNLLILDEPTNHLDMEMRESLMNALNQFEGAVILITHDQHLLKHVADRLWIVKDQKLTAFEGELDEYIKLLKST
jgi:ATP-binding cassette subfamily F protein 3